MIRPGVLVAVASLALISVGCASGSFGRGQEGQAEGDAAVKARLVEVERQLRVQEVELGRLRDRVAKLEGPSRSTPTRTPEPMAPPQEKPAAGLEDGVGGSAPPFVEERELSPPRARGPEATSPEAQEAYLRGLQLYRAGQYEEAEAVLRGFLARWADSELSDNAAYWIGESLWARKNWRAALAAFQEAVERQPDGNKVPDALLKAGRCLEKLEDPVGARDLYDEVVRRFPGTAAATAAEERRNALL